MSLKLGCSVMLVAVCGMAATQSAGGGKPLELKCEHGRPVRAGTHAAGTLRVSEDQWRKVRAALLEGSSKELAGLISSKGIDLVLLKPVSGSVGYEKIVVHESLEQFVASIDSLRKQPADVKFSAGAYAVGEVAISLKYHNWDRKGGETPHGNYWSVGRSYKGDVPPEEHTIHFVCEGGYLKISKIRAYLHFDA